MCVMSLFVTEIEHRKIEPITKHLFLLQDKKIKLAKQNPNIGEEIRGYNNQAWIWFHSSGHKLTIHRIPIYTPQKNELHHMDLRETSVLRNKTREKAI